MLNAASKLKGEKDWMKYETARKLHKLIRGIRENYREDWKSKEMKIRQRAVALYFIDKVCPIWCLLIVVYKVRVGSTCDDAGPNHLHLAPDR